MLPTEIHLDFADGRYRFHLTLPVITEFERKHGSILAAEFALQKSIGFTEELTPVFVADGAMDSAAIRDMIRLGLIGGNKCWIDGNEEEVGPRRALELVETYTFPHRPLGEAAVLAWQIVATAIYGRPGWDEPEEAKADV